MPDIYLEAEFADGFVVREDDNDVSMFVENKNVFHDILHRLYEPMHGDTQRVSLVTPQETVTVDFTVLPSNARPIRFKHMERDSVNGLWTGPARTVAIDFGYQYTDADGNNHQEVQELRPYIGLVHDNGEK